MDFTHPDVKDALDTISEEYGVTVLVARDYGSRAWNLNHEDSDRDIAVVFKQPESAYIGLDTYQDTIDRSFQDGDIEIMAWNIKNFFKKMNDSNPSAMEFLSSDLEYYNHPKFTGFEDIEEYMLDNFSPVSLYHHYRKMAKEQYKRYVEDGTKPTVKKNLYVIRALLYMRYIEETHRYPNLDFREFLREIDHRPEYDDELIDFALKLVDKKRKGNNLRVGNPVGNIIEEKIKRIPEPEEHNNREPDSEELNKLLRRFFG